MKLALLAFAALVSSALVACSGESSGPTSGSAVQAASRAEPESDPTGAAPTPTNDSERALQSYVDGLDQVVAALRTVEDQASAEAATEAIADVGERWREQGAVWSSLAEGELAGARERYSVEISRRQAEMMQSLTGLMARPELAAPLRQAIQALPQPGGSR